MDSEEENIPTFLKLPTSIFVPLLESCFDKNIKVPEYPEAIIPNLFPAYYSFKNQNSLGNIFVAKGMFKEDIDLLYSDQSLFGYTQSLESSSAGASNLYLKFNLPYKVFCSMKGICYHGWEIMEFKEKGKTNSEILRMISKNALAYFYWCMLRIDEGKRIGIVGHKRQGPDKSGNFSNKEIPDLDNFIELDSDMQRFFPRYNEKKSFCIEDSDFLSSAPQEEIEERFTGMLEDFKDAVKDNASESLLSGMSSQIRLYSLRLKWDPNSFFKNMGWTNPK